MKRKETNTRTTMRKKSLKSRRLLAIKKKQKHKQTQKQQRDERGVAQITVDNNSKH